MKNIDHIIWLVLTDNADDKQKNHLNQWLDQSVENKKLFELIQNHWQGRTEEPVLINEEEVFDRIWQKGIEKPNGRFTKVIPTLIKIAASFLLLFVFGYFIVVEKESSGHEQLEVVTNHLIIKENPAGQKSKLFLPDGTIVWLNAESSVQYLEEFTDTSRMVKLKGEAYFEVARDSIRPFIVQSEMVFTEAIGTSFNINSFAENRDIEVNLIAGKVKVKNVKSKERICLEPGEAVSFNRKNKTTQQYKFELDKVTGWKNGVLIFEDASFTEVIQTLKRWYGIAVEIEGVPAQDWQFSGRFNNDYLSNVMEVLQYGRDFEFSMKNKHLKIIFN